MFCCRLDELNAEIEMQNAFLRSMSELKKEHDAKMSQVASGVPTKVRFRPVMPRKMIDRIGDERVIQKNLTGDESSRSQSSRRQQEPQAKAGRHGANGECVLIYTYMYI